MTAAQIDQSYGGYCSFDIGTGELDFINGYGSPYVIPTINTWSADSSKVIMGYYGAMGLQLGLGVSDINTGHLNFSSAYFPEPQGIMGTTFVLSKCLQIQFYLTYSLLILIR